MRWIEFFLSVSLSPIALYNTCLNLLTQSLPAQDARELLALLMAALSIPLDNTMLDFESEFCYLVDMLSAN